MAEIVLLKFSSQVGHEQAGHRPAVVLSSAAYDRFGLMPADDQAQRLFL